VNALSIKALTKTYPNGFKALKGINLDVKQGDFFALLGPNGAGKSTTINIISHLNTKTKGSVEVFGHEIDENPTSAKACIGLVPQEFNFDQFETVLNVVVNQAGYYGLNRKIALQRAEKYLKELELWDRRFQRTRTLSGGMKRRLMIARALLHEPKLLLLDEPTAGVDIELRRSMWKFIRRINQQGITIILTTHYLEEAEQMCRNIAIINNGVIVENTSMKSLLRRLTQETFVLDTAKPVTEKLDYMSQFNAQKIDGNTLEVTVDTKHGLNGLFKILSENDIIVTSMRNKNNRLEELFINLVSAHD